MLFLRWPVHGDWPTVGEIKVPRPMAVNALASSPNELQVAAACSDGVMRAYPLKIPSERVYDGAPYTLFESTLGREIHRDWTPRAIVAAVSFVSDDLLASGHFDGHVRFWRRDPGLDHWSSVATLRTDGSCALFGHEGRDESPVAWGGLGLGPAATLPTV